MKVLLVSCFQSRDAKGSLLAQTFTLTVVDEKGGTVDHLYSVLPQELAEDLSPIIAREAQLALKQATATWAPAPTLEDAATAYALSPDGSAVTKNLQIAPVPVGVASALL